MAIVSWAGHQKEVRLKGHLEEFNVGLVLMLAVLCGALVGLALGEWGGVKSHSIRLLWAGVLVIIAAANLVGLGMAS